MPDFAADSPKDTDTLVHLLTDKPQEAYNLNNTLMNEFVKDAAGNPCYSEKGLENHASPGPYDCLAVIEKVFDYHDQLSQSKSKSYWLARHIGHNTCTYCNRQYTFTVDGPNDESRKTRPDFDHWFPKSLFPLLSLNIYNLIPSCKICNSRPVRFGSQRYIYFFFFRLIDSPFSSRWTALLTSLSIIASARVGSAM